MKNHQLRRRVSDLWYFGRHFRIRSTGRSNIYGMLKVKTRSMRAWCGKNPRENGFVVQNRRIGRCPRKTWYSVHNTVHTTGKIYVSNNYVRLECPHRDGGTWLEEIRIACMKRPPWFINYYSCCHFLFFFFNYSLGSIMKAVSIDVY